MGLSTRHYRLIDRDLCSRTGQMHIRGQSGGILRPRGSAVSRGACLLVATIENPKTGNVTKLGCRPRFRTASARCGGGMRSKTRTRWLNSKVELPTPRDDDALLTLLRPCERSGRSIFPSLREPVRRNRRPRLAGVRTERL